MYLETTVLGASSKIRILVRHDGPMLDFLTSNKSRFLASPKSKVWLVHGGALIFKTKYHVCA